MVFCPVCTGKLQTKEGPSWINIYRWLPAACRCSTLLWCRPAWCWYSVFSIALCLIITLEGKVFDSFKRQEQRQKARKGHGRASQQQAQRARLRLPHAPPSAPAAPAPSPAVEAGIPGEVVAAISAAIFSLEGCNAVVREIRRVPQSGGSRRGAWGDAGVIQATRPFL